MQPIVHLDVHAYGCSGARVDTCTTMLFCLIALDELLINLAQTRGSEEDTSTKFMKRIIAREGPDLCR